MEPYLGPTLEPVVEASSVQEELVRQAAGKKTLFILGVGVARRLLMLGSIMMMVVTMVRRGQAQGQSVVALLVLALAFWADGYFVKVMSGERAVVPYWSWFSCALSVAAAMAAVRYGAAIFW